MINPEQLAASAVRKLTPYQPGKPITELERELGISNIVKLASNENPLGPSPKALEAIQSGLGALHLYPDGGGFDLKAALAGKLGIEPGQITLGNGSSEVLELAVRTFVEPGQKVIFSEYCFAIYPILAQANGAKGVAVSAHDGTKGPHYGHDVKAMAEKVDSQTRLVFIANPNNPTGTYLKKQELLWFLQGVPEDVIVVVDEAYCEYVSVPDYPNALEWLVDFPNLIVTRTFSKVYGLAGLRAGYAVSSPEIADLMNRVRPPFNVNSLAMAAAAAALSDREHIERSVRLNNEGMQILCDAFSVRGLPFIPSVGNFITFDVGRNALPVYQALLLQGVIVRPIANYGLPDHLRVTVGTDIENRLFLEALDRVLGL
ncbi:MAG: histidinol-phosphate transaminase [Candidatus Methylumidiphilus alinenensis]|uniref:Histidinol-phosphate aminotransferase n=1 Tax=Candidatus Methylumidiphilus alinenensis TaxID=2202197 RepID=A0A2W4QUE6_9GAMM|nr:MAG: histidinol-phosphate transaminase [Candidatus Methylumidiphilus alinenensis]